MTIMIAMYLIAVIALSTYFQSLWFPKSKNFFAFAVVFCGLNTVGYFIYAYIEQLREKNNILRGEFQKEINDEKNRLKDHEKSLKKFEKQLDKEVDRIAEMERTVITMAEEKSKGFPWLAKAYADYYALIDEKNAEWLETKSHPAPTAAETVRQIKQEKRNFVSENKKLKYIIEYYENLFPWLVDLREIDNEDLISLLNTSAHDDMPDDMAKKWLTESEYKGLSNVEKYQKALDRYLTSKKTKWQIGRDFERFIGYGFEQHGFQVEYRGIIDGYEDLGRDLICKSKDKVYVVQCKYWSQNKTIHEKHINQLLGTTIMYYLQLNSSSKVNIKGLPKLIAEKTIVPVFVTSTILSETARQFADTLGVEVQERISLGKYPLIKCNINPRTGERIYHLPFDQQYDKTQISLSEECYAWTVQEAEDKGFRRAMRWYGTGQ